MVFQGCRKSELAPASGKQCRAKRFELGIGRNCRWTVQAADCQTPTCGQDLPLIPGGLFEVLNWLMVMLNGCRRRQNPYDWFFRFLQKDWFYRSQLTDLNTER